MTAATCIEDLVSRVRSLLATRKHPSVAGFLASWPNGEIRVPLPVHLAVLRFAERIDGLNAPEFVSLVHSFIKAYPLLDWRQTYEPKDFGSEFLDHYGWTMLVGPDGIVESNQLLVTLVLLGPDTEYPSHSHEAEEIYIPIGGEIEILSGDGDWTRVDPGAVIHHEPWLPHALRTDAAPSLFFAAWRSGTLQRSLILDGGKPVSKSPAGALSAAQM